MNTSSRLLDLPPELLTHILGHVSPPELAQLATTCRTLRTLAYDDVLWQRHVEDLEIPGVGSASRYTNDFSKANGPHENGRREIRHPISQQSPPAEDEDSEPTSSDEENNGCFPLDNWKQCDSVPPATSKPRSIPLHGHSPFGSWRELYASHYPYWMLPQHKLWIGDRLTGMQQLIGQLSIARYDYRMGSIEVYRLRARNTSDDTFMQWPYDPDVIIHMFHPQIELLLDDPTVRLEPGTYPHGKGGRLQQEIQYDGGADRTAMNRRSRIMLAKALPSSAQGPKTALWPSRTIPATNRVRSESQSGFRDAAHRPSTYAQICTTAFRTRTWIEFLGLNAVSLSTLGGATMGESVTTYSTLPPECYTPTRDKPYQGIWVGDYSGHGFEFLLFTQKSEQEARGIAPIQDMHDDGRVRRWFGSGVRLERPSSTGAAQETPPPGPDPPGCSGRLEAIKLTGDPNVPRGEYTFVAEDLGKAGFVRLAQEAPFKGARIVRSWGHVASRGFIDDGYIPSQLILVSHDCIAQFWEEFGHISYFKRVDIEQFLDVDRETTAPGEAGSSQ